MSRPVNTCKFCGQRIGRGGHFCAAMILAGQKKPAKPRLRDKTRHAYKVPFI